MADPLSFAIGTVAQIGISYLFPSEGPRLKDLKMSASTYGNAIPWVFGTARVPGNMIWSLPIKETKKKQGTGILGGKGGYQNTYTYSCTFAMALCKGPITRIRRIYLDSKILYDDSGASAVKHADKYNFRIYVGDENQMPDSAIEADKGQGNTPAYRGLCYIVFDDIPLTDFGNRIPQVTAEVLVEGGDDSAQFRPATFGTQAVVPQSDPPFADWNRGYWYVLDNSRGPDSHIIRYRMSDGQEDRDLASSQMGFASTGVYYEDSTVSGGNDTPGAVAAILAVCADGSPVIMNGGGNISSLSRLDPVSMTAVAHFGRSGSGLNNTNGSLTGGRGGFGGVGFVTALKAATALAAGGGEYLCVVSLFGQVGIVETSGMTYVAGANQYLDGQGLNTVNVINPQLCGRAPNETGSPAFYILYRYENTLSDPGVCYLSFYAGSEEQVYNFGQAVPIAVFWDEAIPGVICITADPGSGAQTMVKYSEDTGQLMWTLPLAEPCNLNGGGSRVSGQLGYHSGGRVYIIDTSAGKFIDNTVSGQNLDPTDPGYQSTIGQPDWDAYLALYPDVRAAYATNSVSKEQFPTVEDYAKYHWSTFGQAEGRTLPKIGDATGTGVVVADHTADSVAGVYDSIRNVVVVGGGDPTKALQGLLNLGASQDGTTLASIVGRLLREGGLDSTKYDVSALSAVGVQGYGWASGTDVKSILDELRRLYLFDLVEIDGQIVGVLRGDPTANPGYQAVTIYQNALGSSSSDASDYWKETRVQEPDLPAQVTLTYMNPDDDFQTTVAHSTRIANPLPTMFSRQQVAMELNVVMSPVEALNQVNKILYSQWGERIKHETRLPWMYMNLTPSDLISVVMNDGRSYFERIHHTDIGADYAMAIESVGQDTGAYSSAKTAAEADGGGSGRTQTVAAPQVAVPFILNTPLIRDADDTGGSFSRYYVGVGADSQDAFEGAGVYKSINNQDFTYVTSETNDVEWGTVVGVLPAPKHGDFALDWTSALTVFPAVSWFDLQPCSDDDLWAGANAVAVGRGDTWEIVQFRDAVKNGDGSWTLTNLLRGRRGSEYATGAHVLGEFFVFLSNTTIDLQGDTLDSRGQARFYKAVGAGKSLAATQPTQLTYEPRDLMPYAPSDIRRSTPGGDITLSWARRTRLGGNLMDGTGEVPLTETSEAYEVYILATPFGGDAQALPAPIKPLGDLSRGAKPLGYRRVYAPSATSVVYPASDQALDGFNPATDTLHVAIYQLSNVVGRGFPGVRDIEPWQDF